MVALFDSRRSANKDMVYFCFDCQQTHIGTLLLLVLGANRLREHCFVLFPNHQGAPQRGTFKWGFEHDETPRRCLSLGLTPVHEKISRSCYIKRSSRILNLASWLLPSPQKLPKQLFFSFSCVLSRYTYRSHAQTQEKKKHVCVTGPKPISVKE